MTIGILPCAGKAVRFNGLLKWQLPVFDATLMEHHANRMIKADCRQVFVGANRDNLWLLQNQLDLHIYQAFICETMTQTVMSLQPNLKILDYQSDNVLFGMPDTYFECQTVYQQLAKAIAHPENDVAVAVFKARPGQHQQGGMVSFSHNRITEVIDKPETSTLQYIWGALAWKPAFWECLKPEMPHVGYGLPVALERGLNVQAVVCEGNFWDCGTFTRYAEMIRDVTG